MQCLYYFTHLFWPDGMRRGMKNNLEVKGITHIILLLNS